MSSTIKKILCRIGLHQWTRSQHQIFVARNKEEVFECSCGRIVATFWGEEKHFNIWGRKTETGDIKID